MVKEKLQLCCPSPPRKQNGSLHCATVTADGQDHLPGARCSIEAALDGRAGRGDTRTETHDRSRY